MSETRQGHGHFWQPLHARVEAALRLKGVPYELVLEHTDIKSLEYNILNKKEPVLVHGGRAMARFWARFFDDDFSTTMWLALWTDGEVQKASLMETEGDAVGFLNVVACGLTFWLGVLEEVAGVSLVDDAEYPALCQWATEYTANEHVKQCLPDREQLLAYYTAKKRDKFLSMAMSMLPK
ncbi:hypothetical protein ACP70R_038969 [Stipagrostis hirtigluma subsp. patula]